ncbi:MAG: DUF4249 domain-containing protein, partial [Bacteroidota bacterium]|nr:DUF4249 domain-containing protein [Bacteroidota bacterium]
MEFQFLKGSAKAVMAGMFLLALISCEKDITVDLPETEPRIVVEGRIETGEPPFILLTRTQNFFAPTSLASIASSFISDATVSVYDGENTYELDRICSSEIDPELLQGIAASTGFDVALLVNANVCIWTKFEGLIGENGRSYRLTVQADGRTLTSTTTIPDPVQLDSLWFQLAEQEPGDDSLGYIWTNL